MIKVNVDLNKNFKIKSLKLSGHSGYDEIGKDIVCSAVSTTMYVSVGLLEKAGCDINFIEHPKSVVNNIESLLKPKGTLLITIPNGYSFMEFVFCQLLNCKGKTQWSFELIKPVYGFIANPGLTGTNEKEIVSPLEMEEPELISIFKSPFKY